MVTNGTQPKTGLECRLVITYREDKKVELGMFCPRTSRYEHLGVHGPAVKDVDKAVRDLRTAIERAGHTLTWCERSE